MGRCRKPSLVLAGALALAMSAQAGAVISHKPGTSLHTAATPTVAVGGHKGDEDWSGGLPEFDIRIDGHGQPTDKVRESIEAWKHTAAWTDRQAAVSVLKARVPGLVIDEHELFGTPKFVRSTRALLSAGGGGAPGQQPENSLGTFVREFAGLTECTPAELLKSRVDRRFTDDRSGITHVTYQQLVTVGANADAADLELVGCSLRASMTTGGAVICVSSSFIRSPAAPAPSAFVLSPKQAVMIAARHSGAELSGMPEFIEGGRSARSLAFAPPGQLRQDERVVVEPVLFPAARDDIRAAYRVNIPVRGVGHTYDIVLDARDGTLLERHNRLVWDTTQPVTMRVFTHESPTPMLPGLSSPGSTQPPFVDRELVTITPEEIREQSPNGWIDDNRYETTGNNVDAHTDLDRDNIPDIPRPNGGVERVFDFALDPALSPGDFRSAAVTQMFYLANMFHDRLYDLGFTEVAGNFQLYNLDRGGVQGDWIQADVQDGDGMGISQNNANFNTSGFDGSPARVQMYLWTGPSPARDGALDATVVNHELAHGVSIRLHGGLVNAQSRGLGEGWSDFFGAAMASRDGDDPDANIPFGAYVSYRIGGSTFDQNYYFGLRRSPYSTNLSIAPLTFKDIDANQFAWPLGVPMSPQVGITISASAGEVHNIGEVWCSMLLDARALLWHRDGFKANNDMMRLVVDAMKLAPSNPTLVQSRDALLLSDLITTGGHNQIELWSAFARRGAGSGAVGPISTSTSGVVQSFSRPPTIEFEYPDGVPSVIPPGRPLRFRVRITTDNMTLDSSAARLSYSVNGASPVDAPMRLISRSTGTPAIDEYRVELPALPCAAVVRFRAFISTSDGTRNDPLDAQPPHLARVLSGHTMRYRDGFESDSGWTVQSDANVQGAWTRGVPVGTAAAPASAYEGRVCYFTGQGVPGGLPAASDVDNGKTILTSPAFDLSAYSDVRISYARWFSNGTPFTPGQSAYEDVFRVQVSVDDGQHWMPAETINPPPSIDTRPGWRQGSFTLAELGLVPSFATRVRFIAEDAGQPSTVEAAIDDFRIESLTCTPPTPLCLADFDASGRVGVEDLLEFLSAWFHSDTRADVNASGDITVQDVFDFLTAFLSGGGC